MESSQITECIYLPPSTKLIRYGLADKTTPAAVIKFDLQKKIKNITNTRLLATPDPVTVQESRSWFYNGATLICLPRQERHARE